MFLLKTTFMRKNRLRCTHWPQHFSEEEKHGFDSKRRRKTLVASVAPIWVYLFHYFVLMALLAQRSWRAVIILVSASLNSALTWLALFGDWR